MEDESRMASGTGGSGQAPGGTGGIPQSTGGAVGTMSATGGAAGAVHATGGAAGAVHATGGAAGAVHATGGAAGPMSTGGSGGVTYATGGSGGGFVGSCAYPSCVWSLIRDCLPNEPCSESNSSASSSIFKVCCSNGVNEDFRLTMQTGNHLAGTVAISKNGKLCYDVDVDVPTDSTGGTYIYRNPAGETVAKASMMSDSSMVIVCNNGESLALPSGCEPDGSNGLKIGSGTCP